MGGFDGLNAFFFLYICTALCLLSPQPIQFELYSARFPGVTAKVGRTYLFSSQHSALHSNVPVQGMRTCPSCKGSCFHPTTASLSPDRHNIFSPNLCPPLLSGLGSDRFWTTSSLLRARCFIISLMPSRHFPARSVDRDDGSRVVKTYFCSLIPCPTL